MSESSNWKFKPTALGRFIEARPFGFVTEGDMAELIAIDRLCPLLVRCGGVRFTTGAQYLATMIAMVEKAGDYVRDVSIPCGVIDAEREGGAS